MPADGLTVTVGVGASLFDERFGLAGLKPRKLTAMPTFPNDLLEPAWLGGDLSLQISADHPDAVHHALRYIMKQARGSVQIRWKMEGYASPPIPLSAHIRLANPRTAATADQRLIRRSYNYDLGIDVNGDLQTGHIFIAYQQDVERQFATVQNRLIGEPLIDYVQPFGGGYFFILPGVTDDTDFYGKTLLA
jgi:deferrochelatase/peroxidase EfeB